MKHTPGPWKLIFGESGGYDCMTAAWHIETPKQMICSVDLSSYGQSARTDATPERKAEAEATARLIAAAPDLLEALKDAVAALGGRHSDNVPASLLIAIAAAEGTAP